MPSEPLGLLLLPFQAPEATHDTALASVLQRSVVLPPYERLYLSAVKVRAGTGGGATVTVTCFWVVEPPLVHVRTKVVVDDKAPTCWPPGGLVKGFEPLQPPLALQLVALVEAQDNLEVPLYGIDVGSAEKETPTVGGGVEGSERQSGHEPPGVFTKLLWVL